MGVSFKVSRVGKRFQPGQAPGHRPDDGAADVSGSLKETAGDAEGRTDPSHKHAADKSPVPSEATPPSHVSEGEVSVVLHLFTDGYSIGKPPENEDSEDPTKSVQPYSRKSQSLFSAIECGQIPGDVLDGVTCKYIDGSIICEIRDYRKATSQQGPNAPVIDSSPVITKVRLRTSLENVVRDIPLISEGSWTYGDLLKVESMMVKALQPQLCLDPTPKLDKLSNDPIPPKLKMAFSYGHKKRSTQPTETSLTSTKRIHSKEFCIDCVPKSSECQQGDPGMVPPSIMHQDVRENITAQRVGPTGTSNASPGGLMTDASFHGLPVVADQQRCPMMVDNSRVNMDRRAPSAAQETISYSNNSYASSSLHKRAHPALGLPDAIQQQQQQIDSIHGSEMNGKSSSSQQQVRAQGIQYPNAALQNCPPQQDPGGILTTEPEVSSLPSGLQGIKSMEEQSDGQKLAGPQPVQINKNEMSVVEIDKDCLDLQQQNQQLQQMSVQNPLMRSGFFSQAEWSNMKQHLRNNFKEQQPQKRKPLRRPGVSARALAQSLSALKSRRFANGSQGPAFGAVTSNQMFGMSQSAVTLAPAVGAAGFITSSANDSAQKQNMPQDDGKHQSDSLPRTPAVGGIGSLAGVSSTSIPFNANNPSISMPPPADEPILESFSKIEMVTMRYQLNCSKKEADGGSIRNPETSPNEGSMSGLSNISPIGDFSDDPCTMSLSKSLFGGSMNTCKTRYINCELRDPAVEGTAVSSIPKARSRMIVSENPCNGIIAIAYDIEDSNILGVEDHLLTAQNTHLADLLAEQYKSLMEKDGYNVTDHIEVKTIPLNHHPASSQLSNPGISQGNSTDQIPQCAEGVLAQHPDKPISAANGANVSLNPSQILPGNSRTLPSRNPQALQCPMPGVSMAVKPEQTDLQQPQQLQNPNPNLNPMIHHRRPQSPKSPLMLASNPLSHSSAIRENLNLQTADSMNKPPSLQLHLQQQQHPPQQNQQLQWWRPPRQNQQQRLPPQQSQLNQQQRLPGQNQPQQQLQKQKQQSQMQRKMMMGMGNTGSNLVGKGMSIRGPRGTAGARISAPMGPVLNLGNVGQIPMNAGQASSISNATSQRLQSGTLNPAQTASMAQTSRMMQQSQANMLDGPQSGVDSVTGARKMPLPSRCMSVQGPGVNVPNMGGKQQPASGPMGSPKMMPGLNLNVSQQQQQQQALQKMNWQETVSVLQSIAQRSQQQLQLQQQQSTSQRGSALGQFAPMSTDNPEARPAILQVSSQVQALGSVGSITNFPMGYTEWKQLNGQPMVKLV